MATAPPWLSAVYRPQPPPAWTGPVLTVALILSSLGRGLDYLLTPPPPNAELLEYVSIYGFEAWGWAWLVAGLGLAFALMSRGLLPLVIAHLYAIAVYTAFMAALLQGLIDSGDPDNIRMVGSVAAGLIVHVVRVATLAREVGSITEEPLRRRAADALPFGKRASDLRSAVDANGRPYRRRASDR